MNQPTSRWRPEPLVVATPDLPSSATVYEVGPRDGLQAESAIAPTEVKVELCRRLVAAGVRHLEVTSFVPPSWIPALADAEEVMAALRDDLPARSVVLVPNPRGLDRAVAAGATAVAVLASATDSFARANLNTDRATALDRSVALTGLARAAGLEVRGYISMAFGDPWEGRVEPAAVVEAGVALAAAGCATISLGDTIGVASPGSVTAVVTGLVDAGVPVSRLALHAHDTYGQALSNVYTALQLGVTEFDASVGGLGRCPYALGATGNLATEDLVWLLHGLGIATGLELDALVAISAWLAPHLGHATIASRVATALIAAGGAA